MLGAEENDTVGLPVSIGHDLWDWRRGGFTFSTESGRWLPSRTLDRA